MTVGINDVIDRVRAIVALYSGIGTDITEGAALAALPAYEVYRRSSVEASKVEARHSAVARTYVLRVYAALDEDPEDDTNARIAIRAANAYVVPLIKHIQGYPLL